MGRVRQQDEGGTVADSAPNDASNTAAKKTAPAKAAPTKTAAKTTAPSKTAPRKTTAAKTTAVKTTAVKTTAAKTTAAKTTAAKTTAAKTTAAKTTAAKTTTPATRAPAKKAATTRAPAKKAAARRAPSTTAPATRAPAKREAAATRAPAKTAAVRPVDNRTRTPQTPAVETNGEASNPIQRLINWRVSAAMTPQPPNETLMKLQQPVVDLLNKYYFRTEIDGWDNVPDETCLVVGVHSGGALTMDAWTLVNAWHEHYEGRRHLHGTAHDVLMATPGLGDYFRMVGVIAANRNSVSTALQERRDVVVWPGGEVDAMRSWTKRDVATLGGRTGFVKQAIRSGVPILPVATVGGHDTVFVLNEGKWLANALDKVLGLKKTLRGSNLPIIAGFPFPIAVEVLPAHVPLPAKIRTEMLEPIEVDTDPDRADDKAYVQQVYDQVHARIQAGMDRLAAKRRLPILG
jgi:1-acyl-sn-glycerol-3-phosphate acyltransferase